MIINRYRHDLFRLVLSDYILIQLGLNLMGGRNVLHRQSLCLPCFFLYLLLLRNFHTFRRNRHEIIEIQIHIRHILDFRKINPVVLKGIKCLLHTVAAYAHIPRHGNHWARLAFRTAAHIADLFVAILF